MKLVPLEAVHQSNRKNEPPTCLFEFINSKHDVAINNCNLVNFFVMFETSK